MDSNFKAQKYVYVLLADEPVPMWRPVKARWTHDDIFEIIEQDIPTDELWEFSIGDKVKVIIKNSDNDYYLIAMESVDY